jgi:signal transduction histidine kinase
MLFIDLVTTVTAQRNLIRSEIAKGQTSAALISRWLSEKPFAGDASGGAEFSAHLGDLLAASGAACLFILGRDQRQYFAGSNRCGFPDELQRLAQAATTGGGGVHFLGSTWGLFWPERKFLVVTEAIRQGPEALAGLCLVISLEPIYQNLRSTQHILLLYIFLNTVILSFLGIYRVFKLYLQPLSRLARRAEEYKDEDPMFFSVRREDNELQRLSAALNSLLGRLTAEKAKLGATVSSLEAANAELKKTQTEMIRAEKLVSVGRLSAGIAHEIGNPLGIITGYLELLKQPDLSPEDRGEYLTRAQDEVERISGIIRQLLEISRSSSAGTQPVSIHALLDDMGRVLAVLPFMAHIRISMTLEAEHDTCLCDQAQLRQVFLNLVINAADAIKAKDGGGPGELLVTTENAAAAPDPGGGGNPASALLLIRFSDNGFGIPDSQLTNIFDPFFTTKAPGKGTGLGLSVSYLIVESFGGGIHVKSEIGKGTTMTVSLPVVGPETLQRKD